MKKLLLAGVVCVLASTAARADVPLKFWQSTNKGETIPQMRDYVVGVGRGVFWTNAMHRASTGQDMFCLPPKMNLDEQIILSLLDQEVRHPSNGKPYEPDAAVEMIMTVAFFKRFPCNAQR